jgi:hypothetical protein
MLRVQEALGSIPASEWDVGMWKKSQEIEENLLAVVLSACTCISSVIFKNRTKQNLLHKDSVVILIDQMRKNGAQRSSIPGVRSYS